MIVSPSRESRAFEADTGRLLRLMVHSLYTQKEIFLRELISNASDALDRFRYESLLHQEWLTDEPLQITIEADQTLRTLIVRDNGIGMRRSDVQEYLGTIARSMVHTVKAADRPDSPQQPALIGHFGVGFYSSFMVAGRVVVVTRHAGAPTGVRWECEAGSNDYTVEEVEGVSRGTSVTLFLSADDSEAGLENYADPFVIRRLIKQHSDFIAYPIVLQTANLSTADEAATTAADDEPLNSMRPLWTRPASEVSEEEYAEFYRHISHDWNDPMLRFSFKAEGRFEYQALLFVPAEAPHDLFYPTMSAGLQLYARRVMVMENCEELLPRYLRFIKGVVDSADLPLHISRQMLQDHRQLVQMRTWLTSKILGALVNLEEKDAVGYLAFWKQFGRVLKEGIGVDRGNHARLVGLLRLGSSHDSEALTTLAGYVGRMKPDQTEIYFLTGESRRLIEGSPHVEAFREKDYEILYGTEPVDELVLQSIVEFEGKRLRSVGKGKPALGDEAEQRERDLSLEEAGKELKPLLVALERELSEHVRAVRPSSRLVESPACLVGEELDYSPHMEQLLRRGQPDAPRQRRILEVNPRHPIVQQLQSRLARTSDSTADLGMFARLLHGYALLAEGSDLPDRSAFTNALAALMAERVTVA